MIKKVATPFRQSGTFVIELALISSVIVLFLAFVSDITTKQMMKGHLQRLSYSAVTIIKERTLLYDGNKDVTQEQFNELSSIIRNSLKRTMPGFVSADLEMELQHLKFKEVTLNNTGVDKSSEKKYKPISRVIKGSTNQKCKAETSLKSMESIFFETTYSRMVPLYQVTLCYKGSNWFGRLVDKDYSMVQVSSIMMER